jgi:predicted nucleic acid binding AN1-type Zn finger protein
MTTQCKHPLHIVGHCKYGCDLKYCATHRLPEQHDCTQQKLVNVDMKGRWVQRMVDDSDNPKHKRDMTTEGGGCAS